MALAASAWVTTEQELKPTFKTTPVVVDANDWVVGVADSVVVDPTDVVVSAAVEDFEDEPHPASTMTAAIATTVRTMLGRGFMRPPSERKTRVRQVRRACVHRRYDR